jgi:predicted extracellular nuclease
MSVVLFSENFNGNSGSPLFSANGTFAAGGFASSPATGQLDSDFWRITGFSDGGGTLDYGGTGASSTDYGRGSLSGNPATAGVYSVDTAIAALGSSSFVIQPTGAEFGTPAGTITLRIQYTGATALSGFLFDYDAVYRNNEARSTIANFSWAVQSSGSQPSTFSSTVSALSYSTPLTSDALGWQRLDLAEQTFTTTINQNDYIFLRWSIGDNGGSGSRDELGFDNIVLTGIEAAVTPTISISPTGITQAEGDSGVTPYTYTVTRSSTASDASVQVTITGGIGLNATDITSVTVDGTAIGGFVLGVPFTANIAGAATTAAIVVNVAGDTTVETAEQFTVTLSSPTGGYVLGTSTATGAITNDDAPLLPVTHQIAEVQGSAHASLLVTALNTASTTIVTVEGIITARSTNGFYIQDDTPDANGLTSEAVFVFTFAAPNAALTIGERVRVTGKVFESQSFANLPQTQIVGQGSTGSGALAVPIVDVFQFNDVNALPSLRIGGAGGVIPALSAVNSDDYNGGLFNTFNVDGLGRAVDGTDFWESVEGMRVVYSDATVSDGFWYSFNGFYVHSRSIGATELNSRGGITINGGPGYDPAVGVTGGGARVMDGDQNPERIQLDFSNTSISTGGFGTLNTEVDMGDRLTDVTGIVAFDFANWKLFVTETPTFEAGGNQPTGPAPEVTTLSADDRQLKVAAYNVENLTLFTNNTQSQANFNAGIQKFNNIAAMLNGNAGAPDVILVSEMQDNNGATDDGVTDASINWTALTQALRNVTGRDYVWVDQPPVNNAEGGAPGANIRTGMIYDRGKVQLGDGTFADPVWTSYDGATVGDLLAAAAANLAAAQARRVWTDRIGDNARDAGDLITLSDNLLGAEVSAADWTASRLSLLGEFDFNGQKLFLSANHWPSKNGSGTLYNFNPADLTQDGLNSRWQQRKNIAQDMWSLAEFARTAAPDANFVIGGDLNEYWFFDPIRVLEGRIDQTGAARASGLAELGNMNSTETVAERFGYTFDGNSQTLDHILVSSALASFTSYDAVHLNTGYNSNRALPASRIFGLSDHDPSLVVTDFRAFAERLTASAAGSAIDGFGGNDTLIGGVGRDTLSGGLGADQIGGGDNDDSLDGGDGLDVLTGGQGNDIFRDDAGGSRMEGDDGNDYFYVGPSASGAVSRIIGGAGFDAVRYEEAIVHDWLTRTFDGNAHNAAMAQDDVEGWVLSDFSDRLVLHDTGAASFVYGNGGNDSLGGGLGADTLVGGGGADAFLLYHLNGVADELPDFQTGQDRLVAPRAWFGQAAGAEAPILAYNFVSGAAPVANLATPQLLYDTTTGLLSFDPDGAGAAGAIALARFTVGTVLSASDIFMV